LVVSLLHNVGKFMGNELPTRAGTRRVLTRAKHYVATDGVRQRIDRLRGLRCLRVGMYPYATEVVAEARVHAGTRRWVERPAGRAQGLVDDGRDSLPLTLQPSTLRGRGMALEGQSFLAARGAVTTGNGVLAADRLALQHAGLNRSEGFH
jgi:hypothetical protein